MHIGSTVSHYKILENLGEGGIAAVYKAEDSILERTVALKFMAQRLLNDEAAKERCLRKAKVAAAPHHSNICPIHEIDEVDGKTIISIAFIDGTTLRGAVEIASQVAEGPEVAREKAIIHREAKLAHIVVDAIGCVSCQ